jgi:16S rRNA (cytosine967-C5)-methyltransferase
MAAAAEDRAGGSVRENFDRAAEKLADPRDKGLLKELVYGTLRRQIPLDDLLTRASGHKVFRVDPRLAPILRVAAYQLIHLDKIPAHAAVNEAVELARERAGEKRAGFVNAVLRNLQRGQASLLSAQEKIPGTAGTALRAGFPQWLYERLGQDHGAARAGALASAFNAPASLTLTRLTGDALAPEGGAPGPLDTFHFSAGDAAPGRDAAQGAGYYAADLASVAAAALVAAALQDAPQGSLLDACAAPGGKALLLKKFSPERPVIAMDSQPGRLIRMRENFRGLPSPIQTLCGDLLRPPLKPASQAAVWLDAPCSAVGTMRKSPEKRHTLEPEAPTLHAALQRELIAAAADLIKPGGLLIYTVCSPLAVESRDVIAEFLEGHASFKPWPLSGPGAELPWEAWGDGFIALPDRADWEGFFIAILRQDAG